jgi:Holliday junction resolvase RusA-like endonuclease
MPASLAATLPLGETIRIELPGVPLGKGRPRGRIVMPRNKAPFISFYTPAASAAYETALKWVGRVAMRSRKPFTGALQVAVTAHMPVPESWSETKRGKALAGEIRPSVKPDADNILKMLDGLNTVVWVDDAQIVDARILKIYSAAPKLVIEVTEL